MRRAGTFFAEASTPFLAGSAVSEPRERPAGPAPPAGIGGALRRLGSAGGAPALLLHCSLAHSGAWSGVAGHLGCLLDMTAMDLPGHGRSPPWDRARDFHEQATAMARAALPEAPEGVHLIGHSFGATVALRLALEGAPARSLTLIEPVLFAAAREAGDPAHDAHARGFAPIEEAFRAGDHERAARLFSRIWGDGRSWDALAPAQRRYLTERIHLIFAGTPALEDDAAGLLAPGRLEGLRVPALLVEGGRSPAVAGATQAALAARLPRAWCAVIEGAGHMAPIYPRAGGGRGDPRACGGGAPGRGPRELSPARPPSPRPAPGPLVARRRTRGGRMGAPERDATRGRRAAVPTLGARPAAARGRDAGAPVRGRSGRPSRRLGLDRPEGGKSSPIPFPGARRLRSASSDDLAPLRASPAALALRLSAGGGRSRHAWPSGRRPLPARRASRSGPDPQSALRPATGAPTRSRRSGPRAALRPSPRGPRRSGPPPPLPWTSRRRGGR